MFNESIKSIQQAKDFYKSLGCSHFHMAREYPQRYEEYQEFKVSKETEMVWQMEQVEDYYCSVMENKTDYPLWRVHSCIADLAVSLKTLNALNKVFEVTNYITNKVPANERVIISETINGRGYRQFRTGLIYLAYDLNNNSIAKAFIELSVYFATCKDSENIDLDRCNRAIKLSNDIKAELFL